MYGEAVKTSKGKQVLIMFQKLLKEVPNWSNAMSKRHADNITDRCAWFTDLLAAVFVACTKILSAVRLKADNKKISLKLPTEEVFIQTVYNNAARDIYKDPYVFHEEQSEYARDENLTMRFSACIENTVKELIPVQQILQTYMSQETRDISLDGDVQDSLTPMYSTVGKNLSQDPNPSSSLNPNPRWNPNPWTRVNPNPRVWKMSLRPSRVYRLPIPFPRTYRYPRTRTSIPASASVSAPASGASRRRRCFIR